VGDESVQKLGRCEELQIRLLVHVPIARTPTERLVVASYAIYCRLRVDREETETVEPVELAGDDRRFAEHGLV